MLLFHSLTVFSVLAFFSGGASCTNQAEQLTGKSLLNDVYDIHIRPHLHRYLSVEDAQYVEESFDYSLFDGLNINSIYKMLGTANPNKKDCEMCSKLIHLGKTVFQTSESAIGMLSSLCKDSASLSERMCRGLLDRLAGPLVFVLQNSDLSSVEVCAQLTGSSCLTHMNVSRDTSKVFWEIPIPAKSREFKPLTEFSGKGKTVLHLTDVHLDLWYAPNSSASCNEALCCRPLSVDYFNKTIKTRYWAEERGACDIPLSFVVNSINQIRERHQFDAVFWTGDNVPHDVWNTTQQINLRHIHTMSGVMRVAFDEIPVFPALGNHEAHPINLYIPGTVAPKCGQNMSWLYQPILDEYWAPWINTPETRASFAKGGYYAKNLTPGWKVIVLNTNTAQKSNFWQVLENNDPDGQLAWLIQELEGAEAAGQFVSILGHIPPGHEIYDAWLHNYIRIVDRYQHLINAGYFGHSHKDEVRVLYNAKQAPVGMNYVSGSLTTYSFLNPMYAVYTTDDRGFVQDSNVYMTNTQENDKYYRKNGTKPHWHREYSPRESYRMADMSFKSWDKFLTEASTSIDQAFLFSGHYHRFSPQYSKHHLLTENKLFGLIEKCKVCSPFDSTCHLPEADEDDDEGEIEDGGGFD